MDNTSDVKPPDSADIWDFFPLIMCINLRERSDRFEEAKRELGRVGIRRVVFFQSERQSDRDKAIIDAHMACLRYAVEQNVPYVLVFEDDALFLENYETHLRHSIDFLRSRSDWNLFHFGGFIFRKVERVTPHIIRGALLNVHAVVAFIRPAWTRSLSRIISSKNSLSNPQKLVDCFCVIFAGPSRGQNAERDYLLRRQ